MLSDTPLICVVNQSSILTPNQAWNIAWGCGYQVRWQMGPLWRTHAEVQYLPKGVAPPVGAWPIYLVDNLTEAPEALGFHDEDGNEVPYGRVGVKTAQDNGAQPSEVTSHECLELLKDPNVNATAWDEGNKRMVPFELCDAVQGGSYDIGAPYGKVTGLIVADFVLPGYFDNNTQPHVKTSYRGTTTGPFSLAPGGYLSYTTTLPPNWQQQLGDKAKPGLYDNDDRVQRRIAASV